MIPIGDCLPQSTAVPKEDEYLAPDGLLHCKLCGTPRQVIIRPLDRTLIVRCRCQCQAEAAKQEEAARKARELAEQYRSVGIPDPVLRRATFEASAYQSPEIDLARRYVEKFPAMLERGMGLLILGDVGTGKTYLAACIANALLEQGVPVLMTSFGRILGNMPAITSGEQGRYLDSFNRFQLLIIDDLGVERDTPYVLEQAYNLIDNRYRSRLPLIITTNLTPEELRNPQRLDRERIYDRILERCYPLTVNAHQARKERAADNWQWVQGTLRDGC